MRAVIKPFPTAAPAACRSVAALALATALLAGCGGGVDEVELQPETSALASAHDAGHARVNALLDDEGQPRPSDPQAVPADPAARTHAQRYASATQADDLQRALGDDAVRITLPCCRAAEAAAAQAQLVAWAERALASPAPHAVLIASEDLRAAARLADGIEAAGLGPVWVITP